MKKNIITLFCIFAAFLSVCYAYAVSNDTKFSSRFIRHMKDCDEYRETVASEYEGQNFTTNRSIIGWRNGFCNYEEVIKSPKDSYKLTCRFTDAQVDDLYKAMKSKSNDIKSFDLEIFGSKSDSKTGQIIPEKVGTMTIKGNDAYITWAKFQNNPYFCTPEKL